MKSKLSELEAKINSRKHKIKDQKATLKKDFGELLTDNCTITCGSGWFGLIRQTLGKITPNEHFKIHYITQKLGSLRFYAQTFSKEVGDIMQEAENSSYKICECCGAHGSIRAGTFIQVRCDSCDNDYNEYNKRIVGTGRYPEWY